MPRLEPQGPIRVFLAVCSAGSFAAASDGLALSASAVAKTIARLEARLRVRLFDRTTRRLALTREGQRYEAACRQAAAQIEQVEAELAHSASQPAGLLRVSLPPLLGTEVIAPALHALCERHAALAIDISLQADHVDLFARGVDLAVRVGELPDVTGLSARRLGRQDVVLCAASAYVARHGVPADRAALSGHMAIATLGRGQPVPWQLALPDGQIENILPPARIRTDSAMLTLAAVRAGHGIGLLPHWLVEGDLASGRLRPVLATQVRGHLPVHAVWLSAPLMLPRLRVTIDAVVQAVGTVLAPRGD